MSPALAAVFKAALLPPGLFITLGLTLWLVLRRHAHRTVIVAVAVLVPLYLLSTPLLARGLAALLESGQEPLDRLSVSFPPGAIVVPGCSRYANAPEFGVDTVSACTLVRLSYAAELQGRLGYPVLLSGGRPFGEVLAEAELMAAVLRDRFGVEPAWLETQSRNTAENARYSAGRLQREGVDHVYLVTHAIHMARARRSFERRGLTVTPAPTYYHSAPDAVPAWLGLLPRASALQVSSMALYEMLGYAWYGITGR